MNSDYHIDGRETFVRRYTYDGKTVIAVDLGPATGEPSIDIVDGTAIVVLDRSDDSGQYEFPLPDEDAEVFMKNGVLTIEVSA